MTTLEHITHEWYVRTRVRPCPNCGGPKDLQARICRSCWRIGLKRLRKFKPSGRHVNVGAQNPRWKGGRHVHPSGYVFVKNPDHPNANNLGYVREHRLVMEQKLGRLLEKNETVHHLNGIRHDNRPENLAVLLRHEHESHTVAHLMQERIRALEEQVRQLRADLDAVMAEMPRR